MATTKQLGRFPSLGSVVPEFSRDDVREIYCGSYRIIYRTTKKRVEILTVYHAARLLGDDLITD